MPDQVDPLLGPGLPRPILQALTPRPRPVEPSPEPAARYDPVRDDVSRRGDEQRLSELRWLAELRRLQEAARAAQQ
jgi:hypothetical protein